MCPYFNASNSYCKLCDFYQDGDQREKVCRGNWDAWHRCGNFEAKENGSNYQDKP